MSAELTLPSVIGISRDFDSPSGAGVLLSFERPLTDDELRALHDSLRGKSPVAANDVGQDVFASLDGLQNLIHENSFKNDGGFAVRNCLGSFGLIRATLRTPAPVSADRMEGERGDEPVAYMLPSDINQLQEHGHTTAFYEDVTNTTTGERSVPVYLRPQPDRARFAGEAESDDEPTLPGWLTSGDEAYKMPRARLTVEFKEYARTYHAHMMRKAGQK